jgi:multiple sugar transport system ATP-binding protein
MAEVRLVSLRKTYKETVAVDDMTLEIKDGEFFIILGPTGGKYTWTA